MPRKKQAEIQALFASFGRTPRLRTSRTHPLAARAMVVSASAARNHALLRWGAIFAAWAAMWHQTIQYEWGLVFFITSAFVFIFTVGLGRDTRKADGAMR